MKMRFSIAALLITTAVVASSIAFYPTIVSNYHWYCARQALLEYQKTDYLEHGYQESLAAAKPHFDQLIDEIRELPASATCDDKYMLFKHCILRINSAGILIETVEREEFCERLAEIAEIAGLINNGSRQEFFDTIIEWRDW